MIVTLSAEIEAKRQNIRSDGYSMSIGELSNLYRDHEMVIQPEYQRLFRWTDEKKSRLIESLLLGIPLPSIFVAQRDDGVWEVVDGLQRISTIFEFMGELRDEATGALRPASSLLATKYLPSLQGKFYNNPDDAGNSLDVPERLAIKRAKLDVKILQRESDDSVKFELFDRLNSGGQPTSAQEVRTAQLLMTHPDFFRWLDGLRQDPSFQDCLPLTQRQLNEQYDLELATRFLVMRYSTLEALTRFSDVDTFLSDQSMTLAQGTGDLIEPGFDRVDASVEFRGAFALAAKVGIDAFRRFDVRRGRSAGGFTVSSFEAISVGLATHLAEWQRLDGDDSEAMQKLLLERVQQLWAVDDFRSHSGAGVRANQRIPVMARLGRDHFRI